MIDTNSPRSINFELEAYAKAVNREMQMRYGISFTSVHDDLPGGFDRVRDAMTAGQSPEAFVKAAGQHFGFKEASPTLGKEEARQYNRYQAALVAYASENPAWSVGSDGIYAQGSAGVVQFKPDLKAGRWRFALSAAEHAVLSGNADIKPKAESFGLEFITSHADIGEAWARFVELKPEFADIGAEREREQTSTPAI